jgi:hypothetical protein
MRVVLLLAAVALAGCATGRLDPHAPKTVVARAEGGSVTMKHGQRLLFPLTSADSAFEWRPVEPAIVAVMAQGSLDEQGFMFTPVRSGTEKLVFEYRPVEGEGAAQKAVSYDVTVR